jgi:hypothetical protein
MLAVAFKEWAVICRSLAEGRQTLILRKGGIAEAGGEFRVEHDRFWLYPTFAHQQADGITADAAPLLAAATADRPAAGTVRLTHFAEVGRVWHTLREEQVLTLAGLHAWSEAAVRARFAYRRPGLFVLAVRVLRAPREHELIETPEYAGCKSWVELTTPLPTAGATPVLSETDFAASMTEMAARLG